MKGNARNELIALTFVNNGRACPSFCALDIALGFKMHLEELIGNKRKGYLNTRLGQLHLYPIDTNCFNSCDILYNPYERKCKK